MFTFSAISLDGCFCFLFRTPPVLALHFVQGLPDNNVGKYAFTFKGMHYRVSTVIQYDLRLRHFVTWVACSDGRLAIYFPVTRRHLAFPAFYISFQGNSQTILLCPVWFFNSCNHMCCCAKPGGKTLESSVAQRLINIYLSTSLQFTNGTFCWTVLAMLNYRGVSTTELV